MQTNKWTWRLVYSNAWSYEEPEGEGAVERAERAPQGPDWLTGSADLLILKSYKSLLSFFFPSQACFCNQIQSQDESQLQILATPVVFPKCTAAIAPLLVTLLTPLTGNSISLNKICSSWRPQTWSSPHGFPPVTLRDSNAHIFTVIKVNDCCVPHLPRPYQYQFRTMKLPQSRGSGVTNRVKMCSVMPWHV